MGNVWECVILYPHSLVNTSNNTHYFIMLRVTIIGAILVVVASQKLLFSGLDVPHLILTANLPSKLEFYVSCAVGQGPCDARGKDLKPIMSQLVTSRKCQICRKNREKRNFRYLLKTIPTKYPQCWRVLIGKFKHNMNIVARGCSTH